MSVRDVFSDVVKKALIADGWVVTHDPLTLAYGGKEVHVDLGAEKTLGAEKDGQKIAVEIKSFLGKSEIKELRDAIGQYVVYRDVLSELGSDRTLYLAVSDTVFRNILDAPFGRMILNREKVNVIVFNPQTELVEKWIRHK